MSAVEGAASDSAIDLEELPRFELSYLFDREDEPTEVTVFPESNDFDISTNWISVAVDAAVPLDQIR